MRRAALLALVVGTGACVPADGRPTLGTETVDTLSTEPTGNADVDRVLARLDAVGGETFTADYVITRKLGAVERAATVVSQPPRTTVRVGDVALYDDDNPDQTCDLQCGHLRGRSARPAHLRPRGERTLLRPGARAAAARRGRA